MSLLQEELQQHRKTFIVIDALDECRIQDDLRQRFISSLSILQPNVNFLVTSRPLHDIRDLLDQASQMEIKARNEDVMLYLNSQIQTYDQLRRHIRAEPTIQDLITTSIVQSVRGM